MRRILAALVLVCLCISMTGCNIAEYKRARDLYDAGAYAQALEIYRSLGEYADSAKMAEICWQKADYEQAERYFAAGAYTKALPLYEGLQMYMDSPVKAIQCRYAIGLAYLETKNYADAISWLEPLGNYEESIDKTHLARWLWLCRERHALVLSDQTEDFRLISLKPMEDGMLQIVVINDGLLLGLPYEVEFVLTLERGSNAAAYTVRYCSESSTVIEETASGVVDLRHIQVGAVLPVEVFSQTITHPDGTQTTSSSGADALMIKIVMAEAVNQIAENLPALVEETGADITLADMGFAE